jgi:hypothetical protein
MLDPHELLGTALLRSRSHPLGSDASTKSSLQVPGALGVLLLLTGNSSKRGGATAPCLSALPLKADVRRSGTTLLSGHCFDFPDRFRASS